MSFCSETASGAHAVPLTAITQHLHIFGFTTVSRCNDVGPTMLSANPFKRRVSPGLIKKKPKQQIQNTPPPPKSGKEFLWLVLLPLSQIVLKTLKTQSYSIPVYHPPWLITSCSSFLHFPDSSFTLWWRGLQVLAGLFYCNKTIIKRWYLFIGETSF